MITKADAVAMKALERQIDEALRAYDGDRVFVPGERSAAVREWAMEKYREAGWTVAYFDNGSDGAGLIFS